MAAARLLDAVRSKCARVAVSVSLRGALRRLGQRLQVGCVRRQIRAALSWLRGLRHRSLRSRRWHVRGMPNRQLGVMDETGACVVLFRLARHRRHRVDYCGADSCTLQRVHLPRSEARRCSSSPGAAALHAASVPADLALHGATSSNASGERGGPGIATVPARALLPAQPVLVFRARTARSVSVTQTRACVQCA